MNPLGLLAGLGALNALSGGELGAKFGGKAATGKRFTGILDMLDGGGAGASGDRFEGGGLLSALGNLFAKPLEAQDNVERIAADTNATKAVTEVLKQAITPEQRSSAAMTEMNRQRGLLGDSFDPRDQQGATDFRPPATARELTGSADMPPELLPMTTIIPSKGGNDAYSQLFDRSVEQGYQGADMPSYVAEKRLIEMAAFPDSKYTDLDKINYASLMPPSLMRQAAGTPTAPYEQTPMRQTAGTPTAPYESNETFRQQAIQLYGQGFLDLTPTSQARIIEGLRLGASRSAY